MQQDKWHQQRPRWVRENRMDWSSRIQSACREGEVSGGREKRKGRRERGDLVGRERNNRYSRADDPKHSQICQRQDKLAESR